MQLQEDTRWEDIYGPDEVDDTQDLAYKDQVATDVLEAVEEYLNSCGTKWDLIQLLANNF